MADDAMPVLNDAHAVIDRALGDRRSPAVDRLPHGVLRRYVELETARASGSQTTESGAVLPVLEGAQAALLEQAKAALETTTL